MGILNRQSEQRSVEQEQREVYDSHRHRIFSLAFHMTGNEIEAEQMLIESFVRAFQSGPRPDGDALDAALIAVLRARFPLSPAPPATVSTAMSNRNVRRADLEDAIGKLPPLERLVFLLHDVEGYSFERIAGLMNTPQNEVNRVAFSARIRLRGILAAMEAERAA